MANKFAMNTVMRTPTQAMEQAISLIGGPAKLLELLKRKPGREKLQPGHVYYWRTQAEVIPAEYCPDIEVETRRLGQCVWCEELNPKVAWGLVREVGTRYGHAANDERSA